MRTEIRRNVQIGAPGLCGPFDGVVISGDTLTMIEVRAFLHERASTAVLPDILAGAQLAAQYAGAAGGPLPYKLILLIVADVPNERLRSIESTMRSMPSSEWLPTDVRYYDLNELRKRFLERDTA